MLGNRCLIWQATASASMPSCLYQGEPRRRMSSLKSSSQRNRSTQSRRYNHEIEESPCEAPTLADGRQHTLRPLTSKFRQLQNVRLFKIEHPPKCPMGGRIGVGTKMNSLGPPTGPQPSITRSPTQQLGGTHVSLGRRSDTGCYLVGDWGQVFEFNFTGYIDVGGTHKVCADDRDKIMQPSILLRILQPQAISAVR